MNAVPLLVLALFASLAAPAQAAKDDLVLVSRASGIAGVSGDDSAGGASISADGRFVAFASAADNLSDEDDDEFLDVFVRDLLTNSTTLVSRASGAAGAAGNDFADEPSISADGRFVAFISAARNFSDEDEDGAGDIFVRDLLANTTTLVSRATTATGAAGDRFSAAPSISADGRFVAFDSAADNLSDEDDEFVDVFVRDLHAQTTTLVSVGADGNSNDPSISAGGRFVAFRSDAANLSDQDRDGTDDVFVRDLQEQATTLVSVAGDGNSRGPSISADGHLVAFESDARNLSDEDHDGNPDIFLRDVASGTTALVTGPVIDGGALEASISADGRLVAFEAEVSQPGGEPNLGQNIFVHDLRTDTTTFVSRASGASGAAGDGGTPSTPRSRVTGVSLPSTRRPTTSAPRTTTPSATSSRATCWVRHPAPLPERRLLPPGHVRRCSGGCGSRHGYSGRPGVAAVRSSRSRWIGRRACASSSSARAAAGAEASPVRAAPASTGSASPDACAAGGCDLPATG